MGDFSVDFPFSLRSKHGSKGDKSDGKTAFNRVCKAFS